MLALPLAKIDVAQIDVAAVTAALATWKGKRATQGKMVVKIRSVLTFAKDQNWRTGDNPADAAFRSLPTAPPVKHHAAVPWQEMPALMAELAQIGKLAARALQWTILTGARTSETLGMTWREVNGDWIVPAERMTENVEHTVPISPQARALLGERGDDGDLVFGHGGEQRMLDLLKKLRPGFVPHGLRSTLTDWAAEQGYPQELREMALAHAVGDTTERAYRRTTLRVKRQEMMERGHATRPAAIACSRARLLAKRRR